jgi:hypothetical protein
MRSFHELIKATKNGYSKEKCSDFNQKFLMGQPWVGVLIHRRKDI